MEVEPLPETGVNEPSELAGALIDKVDFPGWRGTRSIIRHDFT